MPEDQMRNGGGEQAQVDDSPSEKDWSASARQHADHLVSTFDTTLKQVAESLASFSNCELVVVNHVQEARTALANTGLVRLSGLKRPENETALGGVLIGLAAAGNDILSSFVKEGDFRAGATVVWCCLFFAAGICLYFDGLRRGKLPATVSQVKPRTAPRKRFVDYLPLPQSWR